MRPGIGELIIILAIVMLLFGAKRLPALADGMGKAIRNFKKGLTSADEDVTPPKQVSDSSSVTEVPTTTPEQQSVRRVDEP